MGSFTKFYLLLISLVILSQVSFAKSNVADLSSAVSNLSFTDNIPSYIDLSKPIVEHSNSNNYFEKILVVKRYSDFQNKFSNTKKRLRTTVSVSTGIKPPTKETETTYIFTYSKVTYSKPHFLSHLHYFLFRLTPF